MGIKERKEREKDERRELILSAAVDLVNEGGIDNLSIRKLARKIEYSPAIIYHYFRDKDEILEYLLQKGYQRIVSGFTTVQEASFSPEERLRKFVRNYIETALKNPDEYKSFMLNESPRVLAQTSVLSKGAADNRPAIKMFCAAIKELYPEQQIPDSDLELTTQVIWTAIFGLIIRLIIEKGLPEEQKLNLIEYQINLVVKGMIPAGVCQVTK